MLFKLSGDVYKDMAFVSQTHAEKSLLSGLAGECYHSAFWVSKVFLELWDYTKLYNTVNSNILEVVDC